MRLTISPETLKRRRLEAFLNQEELAQKASLSPATIRKIEAGRIDERGLQPSTVRKLALALGCDPKDISEVIEVPA